jgi:uncharacterized membrane protein YGL010W
MNSLPSSALLIYFKDYERFHQTKGNKYTHLVGIPFVLFSLLGLLAKVILWWPGPEAFLRLDLGVLLMLFGALFSLKVDTKLGFPFSLFIFLSYLISRHLPIPVLVAIQVLGWVLQFYGHIVHEKKSPAFLNSIEHLFIGPMWIFAWTIGYYRPPVSNA